MSWEESLINWTGIITIGIIFFIIVSWTIYWFWNKWLESLKFMSRVSIVAWYQLYGSKNGITNFKDKNGKEYDIIERKARK